MLEATQHSEVEQSPIKGPTFSPFCQTRLNLLFARAELFSLFCVFSKYL